MLVRFLLPASHLLVQAVISVRIDVVTVPVAVTDDRGAQVTGLIKDNSHAAPNARPRT